MIWWLLYGLGEVAYEKYRDDLKKKYPYLTHILDVGDMVINASIGAIGVRNLIKITRNLKGIKNAIKQAKGIKEKLKEFLKVGAETGGAVADVYFGTEGVERGIERIIQDNLEQISSQFYNVVFQNASGNEYLSSLIDRDELDEFLQMISLLEQDEQDVDILPSLYADLENERRAQLEQEILMLLRAQNY